MVAVLSNNTGRSAYRAVYSGTNYTATDDERRE
jgi:hypothetical protein